MNVKRPLLKLTKNCQYPPKWLLWVGLAMLATISILLTENNYQKWGESQPLSNPWLLLAFAFGGGLLASMSHCILAMLPVNLSYIGTLNVKSRQEAFWNATGFVLGVVTMLSVFGLFSAVAGAIMVEWRGYINLAVGMLIIFNVLTMVAYALGYTVVIFATSLFAGLIKFTRQILVNSDAVMRWGGLALILMGGYYVVSGVLWFC
jgi:cytochrome c-type biogenesis protein